MTHLSKVASAQSICTEHLRRAKNSTPAEFSVNHTNSSSCSFLNSFLLFLLEQVVSYSEQLRTVSLELDPPPTVSHDANQKEHDAPQ